MVASGQDNSDGLMIAARRLLIHKVQETFLATMAECSYGNDELESNPTKTIQDICLVGTAEHASDGEGEQQHHKHLLHAWM